MLARRRSDLFARHSGDANPPAALGPTTIYAALHGAIRDALLAEGREAELAATAAPKISDACFANPGARRRPLAGRKIAGAAQRRTRRGFLHQGSIQIPGSGRILSRAIRRRPGSDGRAKRNPGTDLRTRRRVGREKYATEEWLRRW